MPVEENVTLMRRWYNDLWNEDRVQTIHDLMDKNAVVIGPGNPPSEIRGPAEFERFYHEIRKAFAKQRFHIEDIFGVEDKVVTRWCDEAVHVGDFQGIPATNRTVRVSGISIVECENGKIVRGWDHWDQLGLIHQLTMRAAGAD